MKTIKTTLAVVLISALGCFTLIGQNSFYIEIGGNYNNSANMIINLPNNYSYAAVSEMDYQAQWPETVRYYIYKISPTGDTLSWKYEKQDTLLLYNQLFYDQTTGNIIVCAKGYKLEEGGTVATGDFIWLASITPGFELNWERTYHFAPPGFALRWAHFLQLDNEEILFAGVSSHGPPSKMFLFRFNNIGDSLQFKGFPEVLGYDIWALTYSPDSTAFWLHQTRYAGDSSGFNCLVLDLTTYDSLNTFYYPEYNGYPSYAFHDPYSAKILPGNTFVAAGQYWVYEGNNSIDYLGAFKFDAGFNVLVENRLTEGIYNENIQVYPSTDNCIDYVYPDQIYVGGAFYVPPGYWNTADNWVYVAKLDQEMGLLWEKYLGGDAYYRSYGMAATHDGGVIITGKRYDENTNDFEHDGFAWKLDADGYVAIDENSSVQLKSAIVYPNPSPENTVYLRTALRNAVFMFFDLNGTQTGSPTHVNGVVTAIDVSPLKRGAYAWKLIGEKGVLETGKFIKQ